MKKMDPFLFFSFAGLKDDDVDYLLTIGLMEANLSLALGFWWRALPLKS